MERFLPIDGRGQAFQTEGSVWMKAQWLGFEEKSTDGGNWSVSWVHPQQPCGGAGWYLPSCSPLQEDHFASKHLSFYLYIFLLLKNVSVSVYEFMCACICVGRCHMKEWGTWLDFHPFLLRGSRFPPASSPWQVHWGRWDHRVCFTAPFEPRSLCLW